MRKKPTEAEIKEIIDLNQKTKDLISKLKLNIENKNFPSKNDLDFLSDAFDIQGKDDDSEEEISTAEAIKEKFIVMNFNFVLMKYIFFYKNNYSLENNLSISELKNLKNQLEPNNSLFEITIKLINITQNLIHTDKSEIIPIKITTLEELDSQLKKQKESLNNIIILNFNEIEKLNDQKGIVTQYLAYYVEGYENGLNLNIDHLNDALKKEIVLLDSLDKILSNKIANLENLNMVARQLLKYFYLIVFEKETSFVDFNSHIQSIYTSKEKETFSQLISETEEKSKEKESKNNFSLFNNQIPVKPILPVSEQKVMTSLDYYKIDVEAKKNVEQNSRYYILPARKYKNNRESHLEILMPYLFSAKTQSELDSSLDKIKKSEFMHKTSIAKLSAKTSHVMSLIETYHFVKSGYVNRKNYKIIERSLIEELVAAEENLKFHLNKYYSKVYKAILNGENSLNLDTTNKNEIFIRRCYFLENKALTIISETKPVPKQERVIILNHLFPLLIFTSDASEIEDLFVKFIDNKTAFYQKNQRTSFESKTNILQLIEKFVRAKINYHKNPSDQNIIHKLEIAFENIVRHLKNPLYGYYQAYTTNLNIIEHYGNFLKNTEDQLQQKRTSYLP